MKNWKKRKLPFPPYDTVEDYYNFEELDFISNLLSEQRKEIINLIENGNWIMFITKEGLKTRERDVKIRKQMRKEIVDKLNENHTNT